MTAHKPSLPAVVEQPRATPPAPWSKVGRALVVSIAALAWWVVYGNLEPFAKWFTHQLLKMHLGRLASAVEFLVFEAPKVMMLLTLVVFGVGIVRSFFTPERTRHILVGKCESAKVRKCESAKVRAVYLPRCSEWSRLFAHARQYRYLLDS